VNRNEIKAFLDGITNQAAWIALYPYKWHVDAITYRGQLAYVVRLITERPCIQTGQMGTGHGHPMIIEEPTPQALQGAAMSAMEAMVLHELREAFTLPDGSRPYNPHAMGSTQALRQAADNGQRCFDFLAKNHGLQFAEGVMEGRITQAPKSVGGGQ
tara:strand:+ start:822 stop:1292 length:471 start_codon:yes stop_codon:yes gene_type:complete